MRLQTPPGTHAAAGRRRRANREDTLRALRFRLSHTQRHSIHHICIGAGAPAIQYTPPEQKDGHTFTRVCPHMHRWTSSSKTAHHMPPRGSKPCFRLDSRSFQVDGQLASTAGPDTSEVVSAAPGQRRSARIGLLEADLMQVHAPQSYLTQMIIRYHSDGAATTTVIATITMVRPTPWAEVATRGSAVTTTRVAPMPRAQAHEPR